MGSRPLPATHGHGGPTYAPATGNTLLLSAVGRLFHRLLIVARTGPSVGALGSACRAESARPAARRRASRSGAPSRDFSKLTQLQKDMLLSARRGAEWLCRMNTVKGRFIHGLEPSLPEVVPDGDNYLRQAGAAFALARAARYFGEDRYTAGATQTVLTLLDETAVDPKDPRVRCTSLPSPLVNRLGAAGLLVLAINELPDPQADLLEESEQLCNYIRRQARPDGSLACLEAADGKAAADPVEAVNAYPGVALYALMRSQKRRPAAWKTELVRKAVGYYRPWWQAHKNMDFVPWQTAACPKRIS